MVSTSCLFSTFQFLLLLSSLFLHQFSVDKNEVALSVYLISNVILIVCVILLLFVYIFFVFASFSLQGCWQELTWTVLAAQLYQQPHKFLIRMWQAGKVRSTIFALFLVFSTGVLVLSIAPTAPATVHLEKGVFLFPYPSVLRSLCHLFYNISY